MASRRDSDDEAVGDRISRDIEHLSRRVHQAEDVLRDHLARASGSRSRSFVTSTPAPVVPPFHVTVAPSTDPKLGVFTGLKPEGGKQLPYQEWRDRVRQYSQEAVDEDTVLRKVKASLRGVAFQLVEDKVVLSDLLHELDSVYGSQLTAEDEYSSFVKLTKTRGETDEDFFVRVWDRFVTLNGDRKFSEREGNTKIFHVFSTNVSDPLLKAELRSQFGQAGVSYPKPADVLKYLKQRNWSGQNSRTVNTAAVQESALTESDLDKIAELVAQKLSTQKPRRIQKKKFACFVCNSPDHKAAQCPHKTQDLN